MSGRTLFIGDIHGCYDELVELIDRASLDKRDTVVSLGDMVLKGPKSIECLELWRKRDYLAVRGNQDEKAILAGRSRLRRVFFKRDRELLRRSDLIDWLDALPISLDFPHIGVLAVHGGVLPDGKIDESAIRLRWIRQQRDGTWKPVPKRRKRDSDRFWAEVWDGKRLVMYGHTPGQDVREDRKALGLDTGCVYGGKLSAALVSAKGSWKLIQVKARRKYAD